MRFGPSAGRSGRHSVARRRSRAWPRVCLDKSMTLDEIVDVINASPGCDARNEGVRGLRISAPAATSSLAPPSRRSAKAISLDASRRRRSRPTSARWASATESTGTNPAPCIARSRRSAGRRSPSATRIARESREPVKGPLAFHSGRQCGLGLLGDRLERRRLGDREIRQHLAVDRDARLREAVDKDAVGHAERTNRGIDALDPERAERALLALAVAERVLRRPSRPRPWRRGWCSCGGRRNPWRPCRLSCAWRERSHRV